MKFLIDTHVLIWWWTERQSLSRAVLQLLEDPAHAIAVSAVSAWEIATKHRSGRLPELDQRFTDLAAQFTAELNMDFFERLPVSLDHGLRAGAYSVKHRDPFDRLLAAQAELEKLVLVTRDPAFATFPCETLW